MMNGLVVDDSTVMRKVLVGALSRVRIENIDEASDGCEALDLIQSGKEYGIVLMDWNMPNLSGIEAVREIRASGHTMPIMMVTTEAEKSRIVEAIQAGANNYIIKPFDCKEIVRKIDAILKEFA